MLFVAQLPVRHTVVDGCMLGVLFSVVRLWLNRVTTVLVRGVWFSVLFTWLTPLCMLLKLCLALNRIMGTFRCLSTVIAAVELQCLVSIRLGCSRQTLLVSVRPMGQLVV